jgi:hypothetical protein
MSLIAFSAPPLLAAHVDEQNSIIRGVSVITGGLVARGHDLEVDEVTLQQLQKCAESKGQVPVKVDHKSGAAAVCGYLTNFRRVGLKLLADWHLLESHPQKDQILEVARRMPRGVGLSASFISPDDAEPGKARCQELVSVDYVTLPAANPDGMFGAKIAHDERPLSGVDRVRRAISAAGRGAEVGALGGLTASALLRRRGLAGSGLGTAGAIGGAVLNGGLQAWRDKRARDFEARPAIRRIADAVGNNVDLPIPGADEARMVAGYAKKPFVRRAGARILKVGTGAALGYLAGKRYGRHAGAVTGGLAGLLLQSRDVRNTVTLATRHAKKVSAL